MVDYKGFRTAESIKNDFLLKWGTDSEFYIGISKTIPNPTSSTLSTSGKQIRYQLATQSAPDLIALEVDSSLRTPVTGTNIEFIDTQSSASMTARFSASLSCSTPEQTVSYDGVFLLKGKNGTIQDVVACYQTPKSALRYNENTNFVFEIIESSIVIF